LAGLATRALVAWLAMLTRGRPVPLDVVRAIGRLGVGEDALVPRVRPTPAERTTRGPLLPHVTGRELGAWSLGPRTIRFLQDSVSELRPRLVIEFGSGVSTAFLAQAMQDAGLAGDRPVIVSLEQDEAHARLTRRLLEDAGLGSLVDVVVAPLARQRIEDVDVECYSVTRELDTALGGRLAEFAVVDGPAAASGARFGTLPLVRHHLGPKAHFMMDDALRDGELMVATRWRSLPYMEVEGIRIIEKGLLTGVVRGG
jgi:hypothetical protein